MSISRAGVVELMTSSASLQIKQVGGGDIEVTDVLPILVQGGTAWLYG
jgi:hypothetical protein